MKNYKKLLFLGTSLFALSAIPSSEQAFAQTCTGVQLRNTQCEDYNGNVVSDSYCTTNGLAKPATSQGCTYACPPPPYSGDGDGDGDGSGDGGCCDTVGSSQNDNTTSSSSGWGPSDGLGEGGGSGGSGGSGGGDGSVLCTYFFGKGEMPDRDYYAGFVHAMKHLNKYTWRGYHAWAVPYVQYMANNPNSLAERFIRPLLFLRAEEISYQMGLRQKQSIKGKLVRAVFESFSFTLGLFVEERDYSVLYSREQIATFAQKYRDYEAKQIQQSTRRDPTAMMA